MTLIYWRNSLWLCAPSRSDLGRKYLRGVLFVLQYRYHGTRVPWCTTPFVVLCYRKQRKERALQDKEYPSTRHINLARYCNCVPSRCERAHCTPVQYPDIEKAWFLQQCIRILIQTMVPEYRYCLLGPGSVLARKQAMAIRILLFSIAGYVLGYSSTYTGAKALRALSEQP